MGERAAGPAVPHQVQLGAERIVMTTQGQSVAAQLRQLIAEEQISENALHSITRIEPGRLAAFLANDASNSVGLTVDEQSLSREANTRVSILAAQLTYGLEIDDDERLQGILESLTVECGLTLHNLARLTGLDIDDLRIALDDPRVLPSETKYVLALRGSYLINAATQARQR